MPALALEDIRVTFLSPDGARFTPIRDMTLRVEPGEFVSVVGPTGCGKSTLLNVAVGLLRPSAGSTARPGTCSRPRRSCRGAPRCRT
jgi:NitT/TauT family transport system ATP-binding protein